MSDKNVTVPLDRCVEMARVLGQQSIDECPPTGQDCFSKRGIVKYLSGDPINDECAECWLLWMMTGD